MTRKKVKQIAIILVFLIILGCIVNNFIGKHVALDDIFLNRNEVVVNYSNLSKIVDVTIEPISKQYLLKDYPDEVNLKIKEVLEKYFVYTWKYYHYSDTLNIKNNEVHLMMYDSHTCIDIFGDKNVIVVNGNWIYILKDDENAKLMIEEIVAIFEKN